MSGPQEERNQKWSKETDLGFPVEREAIAGTHVAGKERQHQDQLKQLNEKVEYYQDIIQRQEAELKNYQVKYGPVAPPANVDEALDAKLPPWISDPHYLSPLLTAVSKFDMHLPSH